MGSANGITEASSWLIETVQGPLALSIAVIAVAGIGFALLKGHLPIQDIGRRFVGVFVLMGAAGLASSFLSIARSHDNVPAHASTSVLGAPSINQQSTTPSQLPPEDPYAGASVPIRR